MNRHGQLGLAGPESPGALGFEDLEGNALMPGEIAWSGRHAMRCEIGGTRAYDSAYRSDSRRHQRAIRQIANPDGDVGVLVHQMHDAIREHEANFDRRIVR